MTLSEALTEMPEPPLYPREEYFEWLRQRFPTLRDFELMKEWQHRATDRWQEIFNREDLPYA